MDDNSNLVDDIIGISRRRTVINAIANYGRYAVSFSVRIFLQAYIIRTIGRNEYAIWPLIITCISVVELIRIGIGSGAGRFLAHALCRKDLEEVEQITTSLFVGLLAGAVLYATAIVFLSIYFEQIFDIPEGAEGVGPWAMLLAGLGGAISLPFRVFQGGLWAAQKFVILNVVGVIFLVARLILVILAFTFALPSLIWIAGINLALAIVEDITIFTVARRIVPWQRVRWSSLNWAVLKKINSFSFLVLVTTVAGLLYWKTDNIIINKLLEPSLLTGYAVVANVILYAWRVTQLGVGVLGPAATIMHARTDYLRIARLLYRVNRYVVPATVGLLFFLIVFGKEILRLYLGPEYQEFGKLFAILGASTIVAVTQSPAQIVPKAFGRMLLVSLEAVVIAILNVLLSLYFVLVLNWGLAGVAAGTAVVTVANRTVFWPWYTARLLKVPWTEYFQKSILTPLFNSLPIISIILVLRLINIGKGWVGLICVFLIAGLIQAAYMLTYGLDKRDQTTVREFLSKLIGSLKLLSRLGSL